MAKFKSRTKYIIVIVLLLFVIAGTWFYQALYGSTAEALRRAENFIFTRMTVSQLGDQGAMRYFFVTNRQKTNDDEALENRFGNERGTELNFGLHAQTYTVFIGGSAQKFHDFRSLAFTGYECADVIDINIKRVGNAIGRHGN